jgi:hypothetical protein
MNSHSKLLAAGVGLASGLAGFAFFCLLITLIVKWTNSGIGSCGPFGPLGGLLAFLIFTSIPGSIFVGIYAGLKVFRIQN